MTQSLSQRLGQHCSTWVFPTCVIGGQAVNAYVEPLVCMDLDVVVAAHDIGRLEPFLRERFAVEEFEHSLNLALDGFALRVQVQKDRGTSSSS